MEIVDNKYVFNLTEAAPLKNVGDEDKVRLSMPTAVSQKNARGVFAETTLDLVGEEASASGANLAAIFTKKK